MLGKIGFSGLRISCIIGIEPHERNQEQEILIDFKIEVDFSNVVMTDNINDTVSYVSLAQLCKDLAQKGKYLLIEKYASDVVEKVFALFPVKSAWILVKKPLAISNADCAFVELKREKEK